MNVDIVVLSCQKCKQCLYGLKSLGLLIVMVMVTFELLESCPSPEQSTLAVSGTRQEAVLHLKPSQERGKELSCT